MPTCPAVQPRAAPVTPAENTPQNIQLLLLLLLAFSVMVIATTRVLGPRLGRVPPWMRFAWLSDWVLSTDPRQKAIGRRFLVGVANCVAGVLALNVGGAMGVVDPQACRWLTVAALLVAAAFYVVMRMGWNQRFEDPTLAEPQTWAVVAFLAWGYLIGGPGRPVALMLLTVILMFNMFTNTSRQLVRASIMAALLFGVAMARVAYVHRDEVKVVTLEIVYFCVMLLALTTLYLLVNQMARLRLAAQAHQQELRDALHRIRDLATHDELTGLFNRRHMLELLNTEKHRSIRSGRGFCLAMVDIDHFKLVNDRLGHGAGDQVLASVARTIAAGLRETDIVARWGGEEFLLMFTDTDQETAERVLQRIQVALSHTTLTEADAALRVTFSAGVSNYVRDEMLTRTIDRADRVLYAAKAAGRNRVMRDESQAAQAA